MTYLLKALTSAIVLSDNAALAAITLLTGAAMAACGPIAFLGRVVVRPGELQVGIVLALVGGPFFLALVHRRSMVRL